MIRKASAVWTGDLQKGKGNFSSKSGALDSIPFSFTTRFGDEPGTNPEEMIGAAHAACFSMALSAGLGKAGFTPVEVKTAANVHLDKVGEGFKITLIELVCEAKVEGIEDAAFQEIANATKSGCPVSQALAATDIELKATLVG